MMLRLVGLLVTLGLVACGSTTSPADAAAMGDAAPPTDAATMDGSAHDAGLATPPCDAFEAGRTVGTTICAEDAQRGYTLFSPIGTRSTYLVDLDGRLVHEWSHTLPPGQVVYLLEDGRLLRTTDPGAGEISAGGQGGGVELIAWDGTVEWSFTYFDDAVRSHHDVAWLPSGNLMLVAWERVSGAEATAAGRRAALGDGELWPDHLIEVRPEADGGATVVWQWHAWDHLVQSADDTLPTFGEPSESPGRIDVDFGGARSADWLHINAVAYDETHDQLVLSVHNTSEVWIIDHDTTTEEAQGPAGDILYRWGNPQSWGAGSPTDRELYLQHDTHLIADGLPGAGNLLLFNNGDMRVRGYSSVDEIVLPRGSGGGFEQNADGSFGPDAALWTFEDPDTFHSPNISGVQRLSGGTTLVCEGAAGRLFEVTTAGEIVWEYQVPIGRMGPLSQGSVAASSSVFRAYRYDAAYPGLAGRDLAPGGFVELPAD